MKTLILFAIATSTLVAQTTIVKSVSPWWVHGSVIVHMMSATQDGLSSWKQAEKNKLFITTSGPQVGHFYRQGAGRMAGITLGLVGASEIVSYFKPGWRRYIATLNFGAAGSHIAVTTYNVIQNPYYR